MIFSVAWEVVATDISCVKDGKVMVKNTQELVDTRRTSRHWMLEPLVLRAALWCKFLMAKLMMWDLVLYIANLDR